MVTLDLLLAASWIPLLWLLPFGTYLGALTLAAALAKQSSLTGRAKGDRAEPNHENSGNKFSPLTRFIFVIPAHNEESGIAGTVKSCLESHYPESLRSVWVIADNCTDSTASRAIEAGAQVFERFDATKKSKGYALECFFETMSTFDAAVIVDADTLVDPVALNDFDARVRAGQDWIQGYYGVTNADSSWRTKLMTYALALFNGVWLWGQDACGLGCALRGNGMCFSREGLRRQPWRAYGLAEDLEFSWLLRLAGERVHFSPKARVYGEMVSRGGQAAASQRQRWEEGRAELKLRFAPELWQSTRLGWFKKCVALCDLFAPPLSRIVGAWVISVALIVAYVFLAWERPIETQSTWALAPEVARAAFAALVTLQGTIGACLLFYLASPFVLLELPIRYLKALCMAPAYIVWKASIALRKKPASWVRTQRE